MNSLQDALYNWLTIRIVLDERPDDSAAKETEKTFLELLTEKHSVSNIEVTKDDVMYYVHFNQNDEQKRNRFPRELIEVMLNQINEQPDKYRNYPQE